jgi:hypothetical protein
MATMDVYRNLSKVENLKEIDQRRNEMLAYCKLDTLAVMELYAKLYKHLN